MKLKEHPNEEDESGGGPKCPYCGYQITADGTHYFYEDQYDEETCCGCGKTYDVEVCFSVRWATNTRDGED